MPMPTDPKTLPAFPSGKTFNSSGHETVESDSGMLLRDYLATAAMNTLLHSCSWETDDEGTVIAAMATTAYRVADAMLEARGK